jgi:hypothetical protein
MALRRSGRSPAMLIRPQRSGQEFRSTKSIALTNETRDSSQGAEPRRTEQEINDAARSMEIRRCRAGAVVGVGASALAKSSYSGKAGMTRVARAEHPCALRANEPVRHAPTYGSANSSHPALTGGSSGYIFTIGEKSRERMMK